jgi:hypothetical protein
MSGDAEDSTSSICANTTDSYYWASNTISNAAGSGYNTTSEYKSAVCSS